MPSLRLDWCTHKAATYAVERWHYSRRMPVSNPMVRIGVWEDAQFKGAVLFTRGATPHIGDPFGLQQTEVCELVRVALDRHAAPVSRILAVALRLLHRHSPGVKLVISFADADQGHHGGIYQAGNWLYLGTSTNDHRFRIRGRLYHPRSVGSKYGPGGQSLAWLRAHVDPHADVVHGRGKHKYAYPFDDALRTHLRALALTYPTRGGSVARATRSAIQSREGGSNPTPPHGGPP